VPAAGVFIGAATAFAPDLAATGPRLSLQSFIAREFL